MNTKITGTPAAQQGHNRMDANNDVNTRNRSVVNNGRTPATAECHTSWMLKPKEVPVTWKFCIFCTPLIGSICNISCKIPGAAWGPASTPAPCGLWPGGPATNISGYVLVLGTAWSPAFLPILCRLWPGDSAYSAPYCLVLISAYLYTWSCMRPNLYAIYQWPVTWRFCIFCTLLSGSMCNISG